MKNKIKLKIKKILASIIIITNLLVNYGFSAISYAANDISTVDSVEQTIEAKLNKYVSYDIEENTGTLIELDIVSSIQTDDSTEYSPITMSNLCVDLPTLKGEYPISVELVQNDMISTNGEENSDNTNYTYNSETGILDITTTNVDNNEMYMDDNTGDYDTYRIVMYYSENTYNIDTEEEIVLNINLTQNLLNGTILEKETSVNTILTNNISDIISTDTVTSEIYNGYIKANNENGTSYETIYEENLELNISLKDISDEIVINSYDNYLDENGNIITVNENAKTKYIESKIEKSELIDILGEDGTIEIYSNDELLFEINSNTEDIEGIITLTYPDDIDDITIVTSNAKTVGSINFINTKKIDEEMINESVVSIENTNTIIMNDIEIVEKDENEVLTIAEALNNSKEMITTEIYESISNSKNYISDSSTNVSVTLDSTTLTNETQNDVIFNIELNSSDSSMDLFENPVIEIELPSEVEKVVLEDTQILYADGLSIENVEIIDIEGQNKILKISLSGTQTKYYEDNIINGTQVILSASLILEKEFNSKQDIMKVTYSNDYSEKLDYELNGNEYKEINVILNSVTSTENSIITDNDISDTVLQSADLTEDQLNNLDVEITSKIGSNNLENKVNVYENQVITYTVKLTNNNDVSISDIEMIANLSDGISLVTDIDLGSYYDENYEYITDSSIKEYVLPITSISAGETKEVYFEVVSDELLDSEDSKVIELKVNTKLSENNLEEKTFTNNVIESKITAELKSYIGRDANNSIYYEIWITNNTNETLTDITTITDEFPDVISEYDIEEFLIMYSVAGVDDNQEVLLESKEYEDRQLTVNLNYIESNQTIKVAFNGIAKDFDYTTNEVLVELGATVILDDDSTYYTNLNRRYTYPEYVTASMTSPNEGEDIEYNEEVTYTLTISNQSLVRTNISITDYLPEELNITGITYDRYVILNEEDETFQYDMETEANLECEMIKTEYSYDSDIEEGTPDINLSTIVPAGKTIEVEITATAGIVSEKTEIQNYATITGTEIPTVTTNIIKFNILPKDVFEDNDDLVDPDGGNSGEDNQDEDNTQTPDVDTDVTTNSISGLAWIDNNKNGQKDSYENIYSGLSVKLYNAQTGVLVVNSEGNICETTTNSEGKYSFENLENGQYLVLFKYNSSDYYITEYMASGVSTQTNSDAIYKTVTIDGISMEVGLSNTISIDDSNSTNIDIGLIENEELDFSIDKYISKVTATNSEETKVYDYENTTLAKIEIDDDYINSTTLEIQYKFIITNEGNVSGIIPEITDYLADGLIFNSSNNTNWTYSNDNTVTYIGLRWNNY